MNISREIQANGVAVLNFDRPGSSANLFDEATLAELNEHTSYLAAEKSVRGLVLRSAKPRIFVAGADLHAFTRGLDQAALARLIELGQQSFERIALLPIPTVAAIHGVAVGGGLEIALACDFRIASDDSVTKLGLPETTLGIIPAWGGSTRLPRLIGLASALDLILTGRQLRSKQALLLGLVDQIAPVERLVESATRYILDSKGRKRPAKLHLTHHAPIANLVVAQARKKTLAKTRGNYPALNKAIEVVAASLTVSQQHSFENERNAFVELAQGSVAQNLLRTFFLQERAKKLSGPKVAVDWEAQRVLVAGAGLMGAGIAQWVSARGLRVILKDIAPDAVGKGLQAISRLYRDAVQRRILNETEARAGFDRILPVCEEIPLRGVDLLIEAATENLEQKRLLFARLETELQCDALATNTSALSIDAIADGLRNPERVIGLHFFNPVHRMQLVEIVRGSRTSDAALARGISFAKQIGKLPLLVNDRPGFLVNRVLIVYLGEALRLFEEGYAAEDIEQLMLNFGMPMGPLRLLDEIGLDVAEHVAIDLRNRLYHSPPEGETIRRMLSKGWFGRKSGRGFYEYPEKGLEHPNPQLAQMQSAKQAMVNSADCQDRLILIMINEASRCLEDAVVAAPEDVDFGLIMGIGWAPFRGGPMRYADSIGLPTVVSRLENLRQQVGHYFAPSTMLRQLAEEGRGFYQAPDRFAESPAAVPEVR